PLLEKLVKEVDCVPYPIVLLARLHRRGESLAQLIERLAEEQSSCLDMCDPSRYRSVDDSIRLSLNSPSMRSNPLALRLLSTMALFPDGVLSSVLASTTAMAK